MAQIGCQTHSYAITDRDGRVVASSGVLTEVAYNRLLNDVSTAEVAINVSDPSCCEELGGIRSWRFRLNIFRGGDFMWSGQIASIEWTTEAVNIVAVDLIGLLERRVPHQDFQFVNTDLTSIAEQLIKDGLKPDDPGHQVTVMGLAGVTGGRSYTKDVEQVADHLRDLADTGIDFTTIGNNIIIFPDAFGETIGRLSDDDLPEGLTVAEDGGSLVTRQIVAGSDEVPELGVAGGTNDYYGLLEMYEEQTSIDTQSGVQQAATARLASSAVVPVFINTQDVTLSPTAPIGVRNLVPGWCVDITSLATCRRITQRLKITGVRISEKGGSGSQPENERIVVQLTATGTPLAVQ